MSEMVYTLTRKEQNVQTENKAIKLYHNFLIYMNTEGRIKITAKNNI